MTSLHPTVQDAKVLALKVGNSWRLRRADLKQWICEQSQNRQSHEDDWLEYATC